MVHITLIYAGLLGLLFLGLSFWVVKRRAQFGVMIGQGEAPELLVAIRAHGNFAEYVPLTLLLMALCELSGAGALWLHAGGAMLLVGRILHAIGIQIPKAPNVPRFLGTLLFWLALGLFSVLALLQGMAAA
ncbi:MAPEG family protein [Aeromonas sp. R2-2]|uniref:MAPEG family protein n=1 Tax=Aeromonas sp. R2-2 TaxID=3138460 RepID=UPI0034A5A906